MNGLASKGRHSLPIGLLAGIIALSLSSTAAYGAAGMSLHPSSWDFGSREPGSGPSEPATFTVTNAGDEDLGFYVTGVGWFSTGGASDPDLFAVVENDCSELGTLAPGNTCTLGVTFNPSMPGPKLGSVSISANVAAPVSAEAELSGIGIGPYEPPKVPSFPFGLLPASEDASAIPMPAGPVRVTLLNHPSRKTRKQSASFRFRGSLASSFVCRLDARPTFPCRSPLRFQELPPGSHRLMIRAINAEGMLGPPSRFHWLIQKKAIVLRLRTRGGR